MRKGSKHEEPSAASLREMPEVDFSQAFRNTDRGYYHKKIAAAGGYTIPGPNGKGVVWVPSRAGRPKKGAPVEVAATRTVRFPERLWKRLDREAKKLGLTRHALLRRLVSEWLEKAA